VRALRGCCLACVDRSGRALAITYDCLLLTDREEDCGDSDRYDHMINDSEITLLEQIEGTTAAVVEEKRADFGVDCKVRAADQTGRSKKQARESAMVALWEERNECLPR
jgi:hypothetical protein